MKKWTIFIICFCLLALPKVARAQTTEQEQMSEQALMSEEDAKDPVKAGEKHLKHVYDVAWQGVAQEPEPVTRARMKCMLFYLELGADDRVLMPTYLWMFETAEKVKDPDDKSIQESCIYRARAELFKLVDKVDADEIESYTAVSTLHDGINNSIGKASLIRGRTETGGGSSLSRVEQYYCDWIAARQRSDKSVYSAWSDKCNSVESDFVRTIQANRDSQKKEETLSEEKFGTDEEKEGEEKTDEME